MTPWAALLPLIFTFRFRDIIMATHDRSKKETCRLRFYLVFIISFLACAFAPAVGRAGVAEKTLRVIYGGNLLGTIKPCG
jgi:hypothetical protein